MQLKMRSQLEKSERNQETWNREERLISSAMFELGVRIMDQKIQSQMLVNTSYVSNADNSSSSAGGGVASPLIASNNNNNNTPFLSVQREALARSTATTASGGATDATRRLF